MPSAKPPSNPFPGRSGAIDVTIYLAEHRWSVTPSREPMTFHVVVDRATAQVRVGLIESAPLPPQGRNERSQMLEVLREQISQAMGGRTVSRFGPDILAERGGM